MLGRSPRCTSSNLMRRDTGGSTWNFTVRYNLRHARLFMLTPWFAFGRLLFTSTAKPAVWNDAMTGLKSVSPGAEEYRKLLAAAGISIAQEYEDVGENHYFDAFK
jgi:hypothetical protein